MEELSEVIKCEYCKEPLTRGNIFGVDTNWNNKIFLCPKCKKITHEEYQDFLINIDNESEILITGIPDSELDKIPEVVAEVIPEAVPKKRTRKSTKVVAEVIPEAVPKKRTRKSTKAVAEVATEVVVEAVPKKRTRKSTK